MNGKAKPAHAPGFRQQIIEWYASGRSPGELARECGCSEASIHAWVKKAGTLKSLPDAGKAVKIVHRQAHRVQVAMALSAYERGELLRLRKYNKRSQVERDILAKATAWFAGTSVHAATPSSRSSERQIRSTHKTVRTRYAH